MFLFGLAVGAALATLIAGLFFYDRGITRANRPWVLAAEARHKLSKIITGAD